MTYTERAWARVIDQEGEDEPEVLSDGEDVQEYILDKETARCARCEKPHVWKGGI